MRFSRPSLPFRWLSNTACISAATVLLPLREALINGDLRMLYVAWLSCQAVWEEDGELHDPVEIPVPPGLQDPDSSLETFAELFEVGECLWAPDLAEQVGEISTQGRFRSLEQ